MTRPRRLYTTNDGKFYYLIDGKKRFVKAPSGISQKQIAKINIKNIVNAPTTKRVKKRRKRIEPAYGKKVGSVLQKSETGGLPLYFFKPKKEIPTLEDQAKASGDTNVEKLTKALLKGLKAEPSSSKITASIASQTERKTGTSGTQTEPKPRKKATSGNEAESESEPKVSKKQIQVDELVKVIGEVDRRGKVNFNNVKGYLDEYYKNQYTGITQGKYETAFDRYKEMAKSTSINTPPPSMGTPLPSMSKEERDRKLMPPPAPRPSPPKKTGIATLSDYNTDTETGNFVRNLMKQGGVKGTETETESETETGGFGGFGGYSGDGLYNDEIGKVLKKRIKNYVPVIAADEINELPRYVARGDKRFGFVINTANSDSDGSGQNGNSLGHWRAVFINNEDDYPSVEYFDPLAEGKMPKELITICRKIAIRMNPSMMFKYKQNMLRRQSKLSSNCGWHSIKFLDDRYNGVPWSEATGYDDYMEKHSSTPDDSNDGEKDISKYIKKYNSFI